MMDRNLTRRLAGSLLFAGLWVALSVIRPTTTFHLAPVIVSVWPALGRRFEGARSLLIGAGLTLAVATTVGLWAAGLLAGPSLLPWGGPGVESLLGAVIGSVLGVAWSLLPTVRNRLPLVGSDR